MAVQTTYTRWFEDLTSDDVDSVGGKNASLGEMIRELKEKGVRVPDGFATTSDAYRQFLRHNELDQFLQEQLNGNLTGDTVKSVGKKIRKAFLDGEMPDEVRESIEEAYDGLSEKYDVRKVDIAARSSATAEDLPEASFAGQQDTFLNVTGKDNVVEACKKCYASLFTDRAITYREEKGFDHLKVALSVGIQKMVRSDKAGAGVMFTIDTESGFPDVVVIDAGWGLGDTVVGGEINPDEYRVFKPLLNESGAAPIIEKNLGDKAVKLVYARGSDRTTRYKDTTKKEQRSFVLTEPQILKLARWAVLIEEHYGKPMDIEWALDGERDELYIVQARPETVQSQKAAQSMRTYELKSRGEVLVEGLAIGNAIAPGEVFIIKDVKQGDRFEEGGLLVTGMTDPDWVPLMKKAGGIVTDHGGRTSHAAIVSRELGVPAVIGTGSATKDLRNGQEATLSCAEGETGYVYDGILEYESEELDLEEFPDTRTRVMLNIATPDAAFRWWELPAEGIGLARMEFIINNIIRIHPMALLRYDDLKDREAKKRIRELTEGFDDKREYFIEHLSRGIAKIAASQHPDPVVVRLSDFKTNEYADLIGGKEFEPEEENPMLGFRGASRYYSERYREGFALECAALKRVREEIGLVNVVIMVPFCRTLEEADRVLGVMAANGLTRGEKGLEIYVMAEIPSNVVLADEFAQRFDGFSIGTNDLTQLVLGVDRDSSELSHLFDEQNEAVKRTVRDLIETAHHYDTKVGICGQAPSDHPEFAAFLVECGIDSISLNPDSVIDVKRMIVREEAA